MKAVKKRSGDDRSGPERPRRGCRTPVHRAHRDDLRGPRVPPMAGRVLFALMCAEEDALTAAQIGERLGIGPAAVSGAVRYLIQIQMLHRVPVPGSRRDRYRLPDDAWYEVSALKGMVFKIFAQLADEAVDALGGS